MKKLIHVMLVTLFLGVSFMPIQSVSAATLTLANGFGGNVNATGPGETVSGSSSGAVILGFPLSFSIWSLTVSDTTDVKFDFSDDSVVSVINSTQLIGDFSLSLVAGIYNFMLIPSSPTAAFSFDISSPQVTSPVPVPAAVWLFGSAVAGLLGGLRRKNKLAVAQA